MTDVDPNVLAWKRIRSFEYRSQHNFFRDLFYNDQWAEIHKDSNGVEDGASLTVPVGKTFVFVTGDVENEGGGTKSIELSVNGTTLEDIDLVNNTSQYLVLPIHMVPSGQIIKLANVSGAGDWHSSIYGYFELETKTEFNTFIDSS